ncbi:TerB family tellurite resistance protein [Rhodocytophaga rosea]|uniref:TerB family tellurite resistance protein n=1 Tax=Rhodocytophaga rosea TaxID=2704465 RepID=A0A6C0GBC5_9BACT|nr:TerB family tellurite resistance protein [Rhodocytophaga rosea]QHT65279.1 TerB family tellurite resistance protein [Rhodocytophaga rosea]
MIHDKYYFMPALLQTKKIKQEHFENLVAVAFIDGFLDEEETIFLTEKSEEFGLSEGEAEKIIRQAELLEFIIPKNRVDKEDQLADAVYMSMVNGQVHAKEYELCLQLAQRLGLEPKEVDHMIELITKLWNTPPTGL